MRKPGFDWNPLYWPPLDQALLVLDVVLVVICLGLGG